MFSICGLTLHQYTTTSGVKRINRVDFHSPYFNANLKILYSECSNAKYSLFLPFYFNPLIIIPPPTAAQTGSRLVFQIGALYAYGANEGISFR